MDVSTILVISLVFIVGFISADYLIYRINKINFDRINNDSVEKQQYTNFKLYSPNLKIWSLGIILSILYPLLYHFIIFLKATLLLDKSTNWQNIIFCAYKSTDWMQIILPLEVFVTLIIIISIFLYAIIKIVRED